MDPISSLSVVAALTMAFILIWRSVYTNVAFIPVSEAERQSADAGYAVRTNLMPTFKFDRQIQTAFNSNCSFINALHLLLPRMKNRARVPPKVTKDRHNVRAIKAGRVCFRFVTLPSSPRHRSICCHVTCFVADNSNERLSLFNKRHKIRILLFALARIYSGSGSTDSADISAPDAL